jgi:hypothetical protein
MYLNNLNQIIFMMISARRVRERSARGDIRLWRFSGLNFSAKLSAKRRISWKEGLGSSGYKIKTSKLIRKLLDLNLLSQASPELWIWAFSVRFMVAMWQV